MASESFPTLLERVVFDGVTRLLPRLSGEKLYALALFTSGQDDFSYVCLSANTEEGLSKAAARYASQNPEYAGEEGRRRLRWSAPDWAFHDFEPRLHELSLPPGHGERRDANIYKAFIGALGALERSGIMGSPRPILAVMCGDMSEGFFLDSLQRLNPASVVQAYRSWYTPGPFLEQLAALPVTERLDFAMQLYRELVLGDETARVAEARRRNVTRFDLQRLISKLGRVATPHLIGLAEEFAFGPTFNEPGSAARKRRGAFTAEADLSVSALLLAKECGLQRSDVSRLQHLLSRRVELDRATSGPTSLLAFHAADLLHETLPRQFPQPLLNAKTNQLDNPEPFLSQP